MPMPTLALPCTCSERLDDNLQPLKPDVATCGNCARSWCVRCHPTPAARCALEYDCAERGASINNSARAELARIRATLVSIKGAQTPAVASALKECIAGLDMIGAALPTTGEETR